MVVIMFLVLTVLAVYAGIFIGALGFRAADRIFDKRDPEAVQRWNLDRRYARLMMGKRTV
jgi:hypothetical protein